jgi:long-subunit acyl-CoA synthetase (AMP-forming)
VVAGGAVRAGRQGARRSIDDSLTSTHPTPPHNILLHSVSPSPHPSTLSPTYPTHLPHLHLYPTPLPLDPPQIVLSKIKARISPSLRYMPSGGAAVSLPVLHFFEDIGIPVCEGYGLTETSPVVSTGNNGWDTRRLGCVGKL